jgi:hypothetical protein
MGQIDEGLPESKTKSRVGRPLLSAFMGEINGW